MDSSDIAGWRVEFRGGPFDGPVEAKSRPERDDSTEMIAGLTVLYALKDGIGATGESPPGALFPSGFKYEVVAIDHDRKLVTVEVRPYR
jgi:hypothetical protein